MPVYAIHQHKQYSPSTIDFDFSILELEKDIPFDDTMKPIALPQQDEAVEDGTMLEVSGWGRTLNSNESNAKLRRAYVPKVNQQECNKAYGDYGGVTERMVCAGYKEGGKDSCQGDSGGPLAVNGTLFGIVSWGVGCAKPNYPGVYSRVAAVADWASAIINSNVTVY